MYARVIVFIPPIIPALPSSHAFSVKISFHIITITHLRLHCRAPLFSFSFTRPISRFLVFLYEFWFLSLSSRLRLAQRSVRELGCELGLLEGSLDGRPNQLGALGGIDTSPNTSLSVVIHDRDGLLVVRYQSLLEGLGVIVRSLDQGLTSRVIGHRLLGRVEFTVVRSTRSRVDESTGDSGDEQGVGNLELESSVELLVLGVKHGIKLLGLRDSSGETIEDETGGVGEVHESRVQMGVGDQDVSLYFVQQLLNDIY